MWRYLSVGLACTLIGYGWGAWTTLDRRERPTELSPRVSESRSGAASEAVARSAEETRPAVASDPARTFSGASFRRTMKEFEQRAGVTHHFGLFGWPERHLTSTARVLLDLSGAEEAAINASIDRAKSTIAEIERRLATVRVNEAGERVITIPEYPEEGGRVFDELSREVQEVLGPERSAWMAEQGGGLESQFRNVGLERRELAVRQTWQNGQELLSYRAEGKLFRADSSSGKPMVGEAWSNGEQTASREELRRQFGPLIDTFIPPAEGR